MGLVSSINFRKTKNAVQTQHNDRSIKPYYLLPQEDIEKAGGGVEVNRSAEQADKLKNALVLKAMEDYKEHVGQKFRATSYLWSAVANIKPDTTMQDLERLATHFKTKYGFQCYQIAIHRDEGYKDEEGNIRLNHHAHLEFVTLDEKTGKSLFRGNLQKPKALSQIQTETADILGMQRGEDVKKSGRKRIEPRAYGKLMNETREKHNAEKQELKAEKDNALKELETSNAELNTQLNKLKGQHAKELEAKDTELTTLKTINTQLTAQLSKLKTTNAQLATQLEELIALFATDKKPTAEELEKKLKEARNQMIAINKLCGEDKLFTQEDYKDIKALEASNLEEGAKEIVSRALERFTTRLVAPYTQEIEDLKNSNAQKDTQIAELTAQKQKAEQETQALKTELESVKAEAKTIETFENKTTKLINKHIALITDLAENVNTKIQDTDNRVTKIHKQAQEEMIQQASNCALLNEELIANKFPKINATAILFGKGVKQEYTPSYDPIKAKSGYRELYRREQNIQDNLANTLKKDRQEAQTANNEAHKLILNATNSVATGINNLVIELKTSADYGMQLITTQTENARLTRENNRLKEDLAQEQKQNKGARDYIIELNDKVADLTHKVKELQEQTKDDTPTPSKSKPTPKPTEPLKSPQPTQDTTPKKPLGM
ncbi:hypothetical protein [Helicobacter felis]|uniref:hypothetical protein n=1 Tax=Helicobacter felis TaxID=214 RepID=UPI0018F7E843|nr:hypothetical protein [Helicobacter felis]